MKFQNFLAIDLQRDFTDTDGKAYLPRPSVDFVKNTLIPYFEKNNLKTAEIISNYRQPRPGDSGDCCWPGAQGYESIIPDSIKKQPIWIKCMNSPIWTRDNIGNPNAEPGIPYPDGNLFQKWLDQMVGPMNSKVEVVLFGLTSDCCVLSTAQELCWRGYKVYILKEAVDNYSGDHAEKEMVLNNPPLKNWVQIVSWSDIVD
jgi:nicotinamidase-related amidase